MKRRGKWLAAAVAMAGLLTACTGAGQETGGQPPAPVTKEPVTMSVYLPKPQYIEDLSTNEFTLWYEQQTGVHIDWQIAGGNQAQAINLMFASGDYPDIVMDSGISKLEQTVYGKQGVLLDLKDLIEEHSVYLKQILQEQEDIRKGITTPDGEIFGLPRVNNVYHTRYPSKMWVNRQWLEQLGLSVPQTTEEFYRMLVAFRDGDPNGNGVKDEIPMAATSEVGPNGYEEFLMNAFLYYDGSKVMQENGTAIFTANQPAYREGLRYLNRLYSEGLLHRDSPIMDRKRLKNMVEEGETATVGAVPALWYGIFTDVEGGSNRYQDYAAIPPLMGPSGLRQTPMYNNGRVEWSANITKACKTPEIAIRWLDWFYSKEGTLTVQNGFEGVGWRDAKEGEIGLDGGQAIWARLQPFGVMQNKCWMNIGVYYMDEKIRLGIIVEPTGEQTEQTMYQVTKELYEPYGIDHCVRDSFFEPDQYNEFTQLRLQIDSEVKRSMAAFVSGEKSLETDWNAYVERLNELGLARYIEIYQNMLDKAK